MSHKELLIRSMIFRGLYRGANGSAIGAIVFSAFFSILVGIPGGLFLVLLGFSLGTVIGTVISIIPGMLGGTILSVWLYHDWIKDTFEYKKAVLRGTILGGLLALPMVVALHSFFQLPFELNKDTVYFLPFYVGGIISAMVAASWTGKRLIQDISDLTEKSFL